MPIASASPLGYGSREHRSSPPPFSLEILLGLILLGPWCWGGLSRVFMLSCKLPRFLGSARWDGLQWGNEWPGSVTSFGRGRPGAPEPGGGSVTGGRWKVWRELPSGVLAWGVGLARSPWPWGFPSAFAPGLGFC